MTGRENLKQYFEAVSLGAFTRRNALRIERFSALIGGIRLPWLVLHFMLLSAALNFPVMLAIARLAPHELYSRLYGEGFRGMLPEGMGASLEAAEEAGLDVGAVLEDFDLFMMENSYGRKVMLPILGFTTALVVILQLFFYPLAALCLGLQRLNFPRMSFRKRLALLLFSSTLPVFLAALIGLALPTVHILVFYFAIIIIGFQRSGLCQNG